LTGIKERVGVSLPFLRWAGGKRWLVPHLDQLLSGLRFNNYIEPFLGGGAVFFGLQLPGDSFLSDLNPELIETYQTVREYPEEIAAGLRRFENTEDAYYKVRSSSPRKAVTKAVRFIYLNHTSFNGIYRVNLNGEYNVPYGNRAHTNIPSKESLSLAAAALTRSTLKIRDFGLAINDVGVDDLVFLDPPYTVAHNNNGFVKYNQNLFSFADQRRLADLLKVIERKKAFYILTNAAHDSIRTLFAPAQPLIVTRKNAVGGVSAARGRADEYLFTNIPVPGAY
jgi:DNA adenine methylase